MSMETRVKKAREKRNKLDKLSNMWGTVTCGAIPSEERLEQSLTTSPGLYTEDGQNKKEGTDD
jgi:hypothetical protein